MWESMIILVQTDQLQYSDSRNKFVDRQTVMIFSAFFITHNAINSFSIAYYLFILVPHLYKYLFSFHPFLYIFTYVSLTHAVPNVRTDHFI